MGELRRRKRSSKPVITTKADLVSEVVTTEESQLSTSSDDQMETEATEETIKWASRTEIKKQKETSITAKGINEISSELMEDRRSGIVEFNYWDESHNWGSDNELVSDDYWHFLGRYE